MKNLKRLLALCLSLCMVFSLLPGTVFASDDSNPADGGIKIDLAKKDSSQDFITVKPANLDKDHDGPFKNDPNVPVEANGHASEYTVTPGGKVDITVQTGESVDNLDKIDEDSIGDLIVITAEQLEMTQQEGKEGGDVAYYVGLKLHETTPTETEYSYSFAFLTPTPSEIEGEGSGNPKTYYVTNGDLTKKDKTYQENGETYLALYWYDMNLNGQYGIVKIEGGDFVKYLVVQFKVTALVEVSVGSVDAIEKDYDGTDDVSQGAVAKSLKLVRKMSAIEGDEPKNADEIKAADEALNKEVSVSSVTAAYADTNASESEIAIKISAVTLSGELPEGFVLYEAQDYSELPIVGKINPLDISEATVSGTLVQTEFNFGEDIKLTFNEGWTVQLKESDEKITLEEGNYTFVYQAVTDNNPETTPEKLDSTSPNIGAKGSYYVAIEGTNGNVIGTSKPFAKIVVKGAEIEKITIASKSSDTYTGEEIEVTPSVTLSAGTLSNDEDLGKLGIAIYKEADYESKGNDATVVDLLVNAGDYVMLVTAGDLKDSLEGEATAHFIIGKAQLSEQNVALAGSAEWTYTGEATTPSVTVTLTGAEEPADESGYEVLYYNADNPDTTIADITDAGSYILVVTPSEVSKGNIEGSARVDLTVKPAKITVSAEATKGDAESEEFGIGYQIIVTADCADVADYDPTDGNLTYTWYVGGADGTQTKELESATDSNIYTLTDEATTNDLIWVEVTVTDPDGNYTIADGSFKRQMGKVGSKMLPEVDWGTLAFTYTGEQQGPDPTPGGLEASKGDAYEVKYSGDGYPSSDEKPVNAGTYTVTVTGKNEYDGSTATKEFTISPADASFGSIDKVELEGTATSSSITVTVNPGSNGTANNFTAVAEDGSIVDVSTSGSGDSWTVTVTSKAVGTTKVKLSVKSGNYTGGEATGEIEVSVNNLAATDISLPGTLGVTVGASQQLTATLTPDGATSTVTWEVSDDSIAEVTGSGLTVTVTGKAAGSTTIWAKISDEVSASCIVTVSAASTSGDNNSGSTGGTSSGSTSGSGSGSGGTTTKPPEVTVEEPKTEEGSGKTTVEVNTETSKTTNSSGQTTAKADIPEEKMEQAVESAIEAAKENETAPVVEINVETGNADVLEVSLPAESLKTLAEAEDASLKISSEVGDIELDNAALDALVEQAAGATVTLEVAPVKETALSEAQQEVLAGVLAGAEPGEGDTAAENVKVVDLSLVSNGTAIHDYKGGKLTVSLPYTLPEGGKAENVRVYYMNNRGLIERRKDAKFVDGKVQFTTTHLSTYVVSSKALTAENEFVDVPTNEWYVDTVEWAADNVITIGKDSTHFGPLDSCTRVQFVTFLWRAAGRPSVSKNTVNPFTDVSEDLGEEFYQAILWAYENGIAVGTTATTFSPNNNVLRGQAVTFMGRYAKNEDDLANKTGVEAFDDVENEGGVAAYYDSIGWAAANGISKGNNAAGTTFGPLDNCSRAEMVTFLYRLFMGISA